MAGKRAVGFLGQVWEPEGRNRVTRGTGRFEVRGGSEVQNDPLEGAGWGFFCQTIAQEGYFEVF